MKSTNTRRKLCASFRTTRFEPLETREMLAADISDPELVDFVPNNFVTAASVGVVGLTPAEIRKAYGLDQLAYDGTGTTIAIVTAYDNPNLVSTTSTQYATSDLALFNAEFGLPDPPSFTKLNQFGEASDYPPRDFFGSWGLEAALDVQWVHAIAPGANIVLVEAESASSSDIFTAVATAANLPGVSVVSMSFGRSEFGSDIAQNSVFASAPHGVTFVASSGDRGSPGSFPAYSPYVLAVGGTTLSRSPDGSYLSETGWSGSGGGTSTYQTEPPFQYGVQSTGKRSVPDVAFNADPSSGVAVYYSSFFAFNPFSTTNKWYQVGGTSLGAPVWAGMIAIANQIRVEAGYGTLDGYTETLPTLYSLSSADFHDITTGSNGGFTAGPGYDRVTGLGSPIANLLVPDLALTGTVANELQASVAPIVTVGAPFSVTVTAKNLLGQIDPLYSGNITLSLVSGSGSGQLNGVLTVAAVNGVAQFSGLNIDAPGNDYVLQASADDLTSAITPLIDVRPIGVATHLVLGTQPPSSVIAGSDFSLTAIAQDDFGTVDTAFQANVTLALAANPGQGSLGGTVSVAAVAGVAAFSNLHITRASSGYTVQASSSGVFSVVSTSLTVTPDVATKIVMTSQPPATVKAGTPFNVVVAFQDQFGNISTSSQGEVVLALASNPGSTTLNGNLALNAVDGVATFSGVSLTKSANGYSIQASADSFTSVTSSLFNVSAGTATQLAIVTEPPAVVGALEPFKLSVKALDAYGNLVSLGGTSFGSFIFGFTIPNIGGPTAQLTIENNVGGATLSGGTATFSNGVAKFSGVKLDQLGSGYTLRVSATGMSSVVTSAFDVVPGQAAQLAIDSQPPATVSTATPFGFSVRVTDRIGSLISSYNGNVTIALANNPNSATLGGTLTVAAVNGVATFSGLTLNKAGTGYSIRATATGLSAATTNAFNSEIGATRVVVTAQPAAKVSVNHPFSVVISAQDNSGNLASSFNGLITLALGANPGSALLGGTLTATAINGVATFTDLTLDQVSTGYTLVASSPGLANGTSSSFAITALGVATHVIISSLPGDVTAGQGFSATIRAEDDYGTLDTSFVGAVSVALVSNPGAATLSGTLTANAVAGVAVITPLTITKAATGYSMRATSTGLTESGTASFHVIAAPASLLQISSAPPSNISAGSPFSLSVTAKDIYGNVDSSFNGIVTVAIADNPSGATLGGTTSIQAINGIATFSDLTLDQVGVGVTLQIASDGLSADVTGSIDVTPPVPTKLQFVTLPPAGLIANSSFSVSVAVADPFNTVRSDFNGIVTIGILNNPGGATLSGTLTTNVVNGIATFTGLTLDRAGVGVTLQATTTGLSSGATSGFDVTAYGSPTQVVISTPPPELLAAGSPFSLVVAIEDAYGNTVLDYSGALTISLAANPGGDTLSGLLSVTAVGGVATFADLSLETAASGYQLQVVADGLTTVTTGSFTVTSTGVATHLVFMNQPPQSVVTSDYWYASVAAVDDFGNVVTSYNGNITLSKGSNPTGSTGNWQNLGTWQASAGIYHSGQLAISNEGSGYTIKASAPGMAEVVSTPISVSPSYIAPRLSLTTPSNVTVGAPFDVVMKVTDARSNLLTALVGEATISLASGTSGAVLSGPLTATVSDGIATFSGLSLDKLGTNYTFTVTFNGAFKTSSTLGVLAVNAATRVLVLTQPPTSEVAGATFGLTVRLVDDFGNSASSSGSVAVSLNDNPGGATLGGTLTKSLSSGVATFTNLTLNKAGQGYTLKVTKSGLVTASTNTIDVIPAAAAQVVVTTAPPGKVTIGSPFDLVAAITDTFGNVVTDFNGPLALTLANNPNQAALSGTTTVYATNGVATFSGLSIDKPATNVSLSISADGVAAGTASVLSVLPIGAATRLIVQTQPKEEFVAGEPIALTAVAVDDFGNFDASFNDAVTLSLAANSGGSSLGGTTTVLAAGGVARFTAAILNVAGSDYKVQATAAGLSSVTSDAFDVVHGQAVQLASSKIANAGGGIYRTDAGNSVVFIAMAVDAYGNFDPTYQGVATLSIANNVNGVPLYGVNTVSIVDGVATFASVSVQTSGQYSFEITSDELNPLTLSPYAYTSFYAAPTTQLSIATPPPANVTPGSPFSITVSGADNYGNYNAFTGDIHVAISSGPEGATLRGTTNRQAGGAIYNAINFSGLSLDLPGTYTLVFSADGLAPVVTSAFTVDAADVATGLAVFTQAPNKVTIDAPFSVTVMATDAYGALASDYSGPVTIALSNNPTGAILGGVLTVNAVNGVATFSNLSLPTIGSGYVLQATASGLTTIETNSFDVTALGVATHLIALTPASATAGVSFTATVHAVDDYGTLDTSFDGDVHMWVGSSQGLSFSAWRNASNGIFNYSNFVQVPAGQLRLEAVSTVLGSASTGLFSFRPSLPRDINIVHEPPTTVTAGESFGFTVAIVDVYRGVTPDYDTPITISLGNNPGGATLGGTLTATPVNGIVTFSDLTLDKVGAGYTINVFTPNLPFPSRFSSPIAVVSDEATQLALTAAPPGSIAAGSSFQLTVAALDAYGNLVSSFHGTISAGLATTSNGSPLLGNMTINAIDGLGTFSNLALADVGSNISLHVVTSGLTPITSPLMDVINVAPSASLVLPANVVRGEEQFFTLQALDISPADQAAGFTFSIDWGDGSPIQTVTGASGVQVGHTFLMVGSKTIRVTAVDQHGGASDPTLREIDVSAAKMHENGGPSPSVDLIWAGTGGADAVVFEQIGTSIKVTVLAENGIDINHVETFTGVTGWVIASGGGGKDLLDASALGTLQASLMGGVGNDSLLGGSANDWLDGGEEDDLLVGGAGNNHLDAGQGNNRVYGTSVGNGVEGDVNGNNVILAGDGDNEIYGNYGGSAKGTHRGANSITVGDGDNSIYGNAATDGSEGGDNTITAGDGANTIYGNFGTDGSEGGDNSISVGDGSNTIYGNFGADGGEGGDNQIVTGDGDNTIYGNFGGDGGEGGNNIIVSGTGNDTIFGNFNGNGSGNETGGKNVIVGGGGVDTIYATGSSPGNQKSSGSILIAGSTTLLLPDLVAIASEWASANSYETRVANISGTGSGERSNGNSFLRPRETVFADLAIEHLWGNEDDSADWFLYDPLLDEIHNFDVDEIITSLT